MCDLGKVISHGTVMSLWLASPSQGRQGSHISGPIRARPSHPATSSADPLPNKPLRQKNWPVGSFMIDSTDRHS